MTSNADIRRTFYEFFQKLGHQRVLSSPLVPAKDPTLLFTNAGMNQFKGVFLQEEKREYRRAVSIQKCMRVSGKHNDFDEVGRTDFHHTFFEMLGNFSFGDYFKEEACAYAWELLTRHFLLPPERLWVTVFRDDDEAFRIWEERIGVPRARIRRLDEKDNFWQMGDTGPCGPCAEIHYDRGPGFGPEEPADGNRRFVEIWNLVFMQYRRDAQGALHPLPAPSIDTGMGMERLAAVLQGVASNYRTDLFAPLIARTAELAAIDAADPALQVDLNVVADHVRALTFLIADGIMPANEGRGYVLRRLLRRAVKHGKALGLAGSFLHRLSSTVVEVMKPFYPELEPGREFIAKVIAMEEERFNRTLANGLKLFEELLAEASAQKQELLPGNALFRLSDTYGFPLDFARDLAQEKGMGIDFEAFQRELQGQKERSRLSLQEKRREAVRLEGVESLRSEFTGYDDLQSDAVLLAAFVEGKKVERLAAGVKGILVFDRTPFYAESGGQVGDSGSGKSADAYFTVSDTRKAPGGAILHEAQVGEGGLRTGERVRLEVDAARRQQIAVHHTATHMLHAALREVLGLHVKQAGSRVGPDKLRFDFTHFGPVSGEELEKVERLVNEKIRENIPVARRSERYEDALRSGAMAIFEEKYGDTVRVISLGDFSQELCGGTHLEASGEIGLFKISGESSVSSGTRRIEAVAGAAALSYIERQLGAFQQVLGHFGQKADGVLAFLKGIEARAKEGEKQLKRGATAGPTDVEGLIRSSRPIRGVPVVIASQPDLDRDALSALADDIKNRCRGVAVLFASGEGRSLVVASVFKDLTAKFNANIIIRKVAPMINGKGGGRSDFAQAGGEPIADPEGLKERIGRALQEEHEA
ncbi:MAG: alanine--tRNA ligase [Acidobacteria bacterium]|jgi:alanyl-tRNA synthetase|nr:alanine--tRNA ligase [Acidobacteriota bacterium]